MKEKKENKENSGLNQPVERRDLLKGLATLPVLGAFVYGVLKKSRQENLLKRMVLDELGLSTTEPVNIFKPISGGDKLKVGIIGYGGRGNHLVRSCGYASPQTIDSWRSSAAQNRNDKRYDDYLAQEDLNVEISAVCDVYDLHAEEALAASANLGREGREGTFVKPARRYSTYQELIDSTEVDAVIVATPDHLHASMAIYAAKAGKHVYLEKGMTCTLEETFALRKAVKESGIIFQLGHQGRHTDSYSKAREIIEKEVLGKITLIEVCTNRNDPNGAWVYNIPDEAGEHNIDWKQFIGPAPWHPFSLERFFRWRCWWDYGTGLSGDLFTHEYDAMNQILRLGIPHSAIASGGIYFYKDGRDVPDVFQSVFEYPDRDLTLLYSATLASDRYRGKVIMGHDAQMELSNLLTVYADPQSTRYREQLQNGTVKPNEPLYTYIPGRKSIDAVASATEQYFASRGLLYTYQDGRRVDTTYLHIREWIQCIREGVQPSCNIDEGFDEAITAHMATISYRENRKVFWDNENEKII